MRGLSELSPKPLLPLCGRPLIEWSLNALSEAGVTRVGVNTHHLSEQLKSALSARELTWSDEPVLQGTGGGVRALWARLLQRGPAPSALLCLNGDAWFDFPLHPLLEAHQARPGLDATLMLRATSYDDPFGRVGLNAQGEVVRIAEIEGPRAHEEVSVGAFLGAQLLSPQLIASIPEGPCDLFRSAFKRRFAEGARFGSCLAPSAHLWADVGTPERYLDLHRELIERLNSDALPPAIQSQLPQLKLRRSSAGGLIALMEGARCDEGAHVERFAFLYPGAQLREGLMVERGVLWPHANPESSLRPQSGVWTTRGFIEASGGLNDGAVGAQR